MKRLALTINGDLTYCSASEENIGKGRCNHLSHQSTIESIDDFMAKASKIQECISNGEKFTILKKSRLKEKMKLEGMQKKFYQDGYFYKLDTSYEMREERNALSEDLCSLILKHMDIDHAEYEMVKLFDEDNNLYSSPCIRSKNFLKKDEELISLSDVISKKLANEIITNDSGDFSDIVDKIDFEIENKTGIKNYKEHLAKILSFDILTMNSDRHLNNIGLIYNSKDDRWKISPIYDNGAALLANKDCDNLNEYNYYYEENTTMYDLSTFGLSPLDSYIDIVVREFKKDKTKRIHIKDYNLLIEEIENYENGFYDSKDVSRIKNILLMQFDEYESLFIKD